MFVTQILLSQMFRFKSFEPKRSCDFSLIIVYKLSISIVTSLNNLSPKNTTEIVT